MNYFPLFVGWLSPWHRCPVVSVTNLLLMLELWLWAVISIRLTVVILLESLSWEYHPWSPCHQELPVKIHPEQQSWPSRPWSKPLMKKFSSLHLKSNVIINTPQHLQWTHFFSQLRGLTDNGMTSASTYAPRCWTKILWIKPLGCSNAKLWRRKAGLTTWKLMKKESQIF